jgi:hypothetical protein
MKTSDKKSWLQTGLTTGVMVLVFTILTANFILIIEPHHTQFMKPKCDLDNVCLYIYSADGKQIDVKHNPTKCAEPFTQFEYSFMIVIEELKHHYTINKSPVFHDVSSSDNVCLYVFTPDGISVAIHGNPTSCADPIVFGSLN